MQAPPCLPVSDIAVACGRRLPPLRLAWPGIIFSVCVPRACVGRRCWRRHGQHGGRCTADECSLRRDAISQCPVVAV